MRGPYYDQQFEGTFILFKKLKKVFIIDIIIEKWMTITLAKTPHKEG